ncbi:hypothetical protein JMJ35_000961 [Cladonia borealis]|uniref:SMODS and SLOG-associating 2TM effector domain-containing protein n=1 Tax=Cladonia borealis TaxID=184061 RepID=A0AA39V4U7_9LECA|nr:hypothetical protein JMJ35_000961 [Cladonia borealis]
MPPDPDLEGRDAPPPRRSSFDGPPPPKLVKFRNLTGIDTPGNIKRDYRQRPAKNVGIYSRVVSEEKKTQVQYYIMASIIEASFLSQIVVAATLTALGAADASYIAITVLGSVNTVIAGIQTYLKGQGLPNRLRQYEFGLRKLREYIEDRERDFSHADCPRNVDHEIADIAAMYKAVRQTAEDNTPENYLPMAGAGKKLLGEVASRITGKDENTGLSTGLLSDPPTEETAPDTAGSSKPNAAASDTPEQANGAKPPSSERAGAADQPNHEAEEPAATGSTPNEEGETEETPLLQRDDKAAADSK